MPSVSGVIENDQFLFDLYGGLPSFEKINLHQVTFNWDGPRVNLIFDLDRFPLNPPIKWNKFNIAQIELSLFPLLKVDLKSFSGSNICSLHIERQNNFIIVTTRGGHVRILSRRLFGLLGFLRILTCSRYLVRSYVGWFFHVKIIYY